MKDYPIPFCGPYGFVFRQSCLRYSSFKVSNDLERKKNVNKVIKLTGWNSGAYALVSARSDITSRELVRSFKCGDLGCLYVGGSEFRLRDRVYLLSSYVNKRSTSHHLYSRHGFLEYLEGMDYYIIVISFSHGIALERSIINECISEVRHRPDLNCQYYQNTTSRMGWVDEDERGFAGAMRLKESPISQKDAYIEWLSRDD